MKSSSSIRQAGFVISLEAVIIATILGIGLIVGIVAVRDALFRKALSIRNMNFYVFDSTPDESIAIGKVISFDEHEAPWVPFIDYDPLGDGRNHRALIGVRDDRFTSRQPIFYTGAACTGNPCIAEAGEEAPYNFGVDGIATTGAVGYLYALQGLSYGIGAGPADDAGTPFDETLVGRLYRQGVGACGPVVSAWDSQRVVTGSPCITVSGVAPLVNAVSVDSPAGGNVLDVLVPPFWINEVATPPLLTPRAPSTDENTPMPPP